MENLLSRPAPFRLGLAVVLTLAATFVAGLVLAPRPADAVGGLGLMDRVMLTGTVRSFGTNCGQTPYTVPEGRRFFLTYVAVGFHRQEENAGRFTVGGVHLGQALRSGLQGNPNVVISLATPIVYGENTALAVECRWVEGVALVGYELLRPSGRS